MLSDLLFLAEAPAHEAASGVTKILSDFGIDVPLFLAQALNFAIVAFLLWRFAFKPVLATIEERQRQISGSLKDAADIKAKLAATQQESLQIIQKAHADASAVIEEARKTAKELADREAKAATERANEMITKAQQAIELEHKRLMEQARGEIARLVVSTTQKVLSRDLSDSERSRFNDAAARELTQV